MRIILSPALTLLLLAFVSASAQTVAASQPIPGLGPVGEVRRVHTGFQFTEGPAADTSGNLYFTDPRASKILIARADGSLDTFLENSQGANGLMFDARGRLVACQGGAGRIIAIDVATKKISILAGEFGGRRFNAPNDLVVDRQGGVYFTDPAFRAGTQDKEGAYYLAPDGKVTRIIDNQPRPNGVLLSPDERTLYLLPSGKPGVMAYPVTAPGNPGVGKTFGALERPGDGLTVDERGNLYVTQPALGGIAILSPEGKTLGFLKVPENPSNCAFGGADMKTLFVTARTSLYAFTMEVAGHRFAAKARAAVTSPATESAPLATGSTDAAEAAQRRRELETELAERRAKAQAEFRARMAPLSFEERLSAIGTMIDYLEAREENKSLTVPEERQLAGLRALLADTNRVAAIGRDGNAGGRPTDLTPSISSQPAAPVTTTSFVKAASEFLSALTPAQREKAVFRFDDEERFNWGYEPRVRKGVALAELNGAQRAAAFALLAAGLSAEGFTKATNVFSIERAMVAARYNVPIGPDQYFISLFGEPGGTGRWAARFEGHHAAFNFTVADGRLVSITPTMLGAFPATVADGPRKGLRVLGAEEDLGRELVKSLTAEQRRRAIAGEKAPINVLSGWKRETAPLRGGLPASELNEAQRALLEKLVGEFIGRAPRELAASKLAEFRQAGWDNISFAWLGGVEQGEGHYYRVQTPRFLLEYCNANNNANHAHTVWRDFANDFGRMNP